MDAPEGPQIRDALEVEITKGPNKGLYSSRVQDITKAYLAIDRLEDPHGTPLQVKRSPLEVRFHREGFLYEFKSEILEDRLERIPLTLIKKPGAIRHIERRRDYRMSCLIPATCKPVGQGISHSFKANIVDISAGGARISSRTRIPAGSLLKITFDLPGTKDYCAVQGKVIHTLENPPAKQFLLTMFWNLDRRTQAKLHRFTMLRQIDLRRKGILLPHESRESSGR
jgi:c-di-GMP-binding flagellar brake protein YcgR